MGRYDVVSYVEANLLQLFLFERFQGLTPDPQVIKAPQPQIVGEAKKVKSV